MLIPGVENLSFFFFAAKEVGELAKEKEGKNKSLSLIPLSFYILLGIALRLFMSVLLNALSLVIRKIRIRNEKEELEKAKLDKEELKEERISVPFNQYTEE